MNNVCMITQSPYPGDPRVRREAEALEKEGIQVDIICMPEHEYDAPRECFGGVTAYRLQIKPSNRDNMRNYLKTTFKFVVKAFFRLNKLDVTRKYKAVQVHNMPDSHVFIAILQKVKGTPIVLDIHDLTPELFLERWGKKKWLIRFVKIMEKVSCRFSNQLITVTPKCKENLVDRGVPPEKITLVLNTANEGMFKFNADREYNKVNKNAKLLYHGTVAERFGIHTAIEAMPYIVQSIPGTVFNIYGIDDNHYTKYLLQLIKKLDMKDNVKLYKGILLDDLIPIINESDLEIVPYIASTYMHLSLPTKICECASAGLAVVSTELDTLKTIFDDSCIQYFENSNPNDLAHKVVTLLLDGAERREKTINAKIALESISGSVMSKRYIKLMKQVMGIKEEVKIIKKEAKAILS